MSGHHVLTDHKGHEAVVESETALICTTCQKREGRLTRLLLPRPADPSKQPTPTPPPFREVINGRGVPPTDVEEWRKARERFGSRRPSGEAS